MMSRAHIHCLEIGYCLIIIVIPVPIDLTTFAAKRPLNELL